MGIYKSKEVLKQVIVRKPDHKLQIKITVDISTHALEWVKKKIRLKFTKKIKHAEPQPLGLVSYKKKCSTYISLNS